MHLSVAPPEIPPLVETVVRVHFVERGKSSPTLFSPAHRKGTVGVDADAYERRDPEAAREVMGAAAYFKRVSPSLLTWRGRPNLR